GSIVRSCGVLNSAGPDPSLPNDRMYFPSFVNREMRATVLAGASGCWPEWPSAMKRSPFGATTMLHGSVSAPSCGWPATPGFPIVISTFPSWSNLTTVWPAGLASGNFVLSLIKTSHIDDPNTAFPVLVDAVREHEQPRAEALQDVAVGIELVDRRPARAGAAVVLERRGTGRNVGIGAAAVHHPERAAVVVDRYPVQRAPLVPL